MSLDLNRQSKEMQQFRETMGNDNKSKFKESSEKLVSDLAEAVGNLFDSQDGEE